MAYFLTSGVNPLPKLLGQTPAQGDPIMVEPGDSAEITLPPNRYEGLKAFLGTKRPLSELTTANYRIVVVYFADGSAWSAGNYLQPDPANPGHFLHPATKQ